MMSRTYHSNQTLSAVLSHGILLTLSLPNVAKSKFRPNFQISFCKILKNKWHHVWVQAESFHLNGHIIRFRPPAQKLESPHKTPASTLAVKGIIWYGTNILVCRSNPVVVTLKRDLFGSTFTLCLIHVVCSSNFWVCGWNPMKLPLKKTSLPLLSHGILYIED